MLAIVLIPSAALSIIGIGASGYLVYDGYNAQKWATTMQDTVAPGTTFAAGAQEERRLSLQVLGGDRSAVPELQQARADFDEAVANIKGLMGGLNELNPEAIEQANKIFPKLIGEQLPQIRQGVDAGVVPWSDVYAYYTGVVELIKLGLQGIAETAPDSKTAVEESTATTLFAVADSMSRAHGLAIGGVVRGGFSVEEYMEVSRQVGRYHTDMESVLPILTPELQQRYTALAKSPEWQLLTQVEGALLLTPPGAELPQLPVTIAQWRNATTVVTAELLDIYSAHHHYAEGFAADTGKDTFVNSLLGGGAVLLVTIIAALTAIRLSNRVVKRMKKLRAETLELADTRLPRMVERLRAGEQLDVDTEVPPLDHGQDELGQVAEAFNKAQRTAVAAAAHEAETQNGVRAVFLNIAHRSQVVVRRQLEVLDNAERKQEDPEQLETLFQLDHLATRSRRNAENLIILGGEQPGRQWRNPVPLVEIVRSAVSETEHYRRVHTSRLPDIAMTGSVVADLIHLLAELVDNATSFSPPDSRVEVRGNMVGKGVVIEVEDQGLGIERAEREEVNAFLHNPPDFGVMALSEDARLGLFVVSQLAARHGISVTLVESVYGGIRAIVLIRSALIADTEPRPAHLDDTAPAETTDTLPPLRREFSEMPTPESYPPERESLPHRNSDAARKVWTPPVEDVPETPETMDAHAVGNGSGQSRPADGRPPLPQRRRQANLSPRLVAEATEPAPAAVEEPSETDAVRTAELARNRMTAFQRGTRDGRAAP